MSIELKVSGLDQLIGTVNRAAGGFTPAVREYLNDKVQQLFTIYKPSLPVKTGHLRNSAYVKKSTGFTATVGNTAEYAIYIEEGTRYISAHYNLRDAVNTIISQMRGGQELAQRLQTILGFSR